MSSDKKKIGVAICGCDDTTSFFIDLSEVELNILKIISEISIKVSTYGCMPKIEIYEDLISKNDYIDEETYYEQR